MRGVYNCSDCIHWHCQLCVGCCEVYPPRNYKSKALYKAEYEEYKSQIKDLKQEIENLKYKNNYLAECALEEQNELNKEIKNLKKDIETLLKHEQEWMSFKDTLEEDKHKALFENRDLKQSIAKYKLDLGLLLQLHCGRCEDPAECPNCGWDFLKEDLGLK